MPRNPLWIGTFAWPRHAQWVHDAVTPLETRHDQRRVADTARAPTGIPLFDEHLEEEIEARLGWRITVTINRIRRDPAGRIEVSSR